MRILVAEDEKMARFALRTSLSAWGHEVVEAADGETALHILQSDNYPRLAILDWAMPGLSGIDVCSRIRSETGRAQEYIYMIFVTGKQESEDMVAGFDAGVDDYIIKPFEPMELRARITAGARILKLHDQLRAARNKAERSRLELMRLNESLEAIVEERTHHIQELLDQRNHVLRQFGNDLQTPLMPMVNKLPLLEEHIENEEGRKILEAALRNTEYMNRLIEKTVELARMNSEEFALQFEEVDLSSVISDVAAHLSSRLEMKGIELHNHVRGALYVDGSPNLLKELFEAILGNAVKFMGGPGRIEIKKKHEGPRVVIEISDTGEGMSSDELSRAFDEFYKAHESKSYDLSTGLGLSICRRIVEKHGGSIWIESEGKWQGTTVSISLRARKAGTVESAC